MSLVEQTAAISGRQVESMAEAYDGATVSVEYYTDPLCSWSWAFEPQWRRLRYEYADHLNWHYRMGGLVADWQSYDDPLNAIGNSAQMGPQWLQVREISGMPLDMRIWQSDPPASSYPACIAVKAAECQGQAAAESYLRRLREAVMMEGRNIARQEVLLQVARACDESRQLDFSRFQRDLSGDEPAEAFRQDLRDAAYHNFGRFPTLILRLLDRRAIMLVGYRPYEVLLDALQHLAPDLHQRPPMSREELAVSYVTYWQRVTARELAEILGCDHRETATLLNSLLSRGMLMQANASLPIYAPPPLAVQE